MAKVATYLPRSPVIYGMRSPITTQDVKAVNQMATWYQQEKRSNYVGIYGYGTSTKVAVNYDITGTSSTWKELARYYLWIDADDSGGLQWNVAANGSVVADSLGGRSEVRLILNGGATLSTKSISAAGYSGYTTLSGHTGGAWNDIILQGRAVGTATGSGDSFLTDTIYSVSVNSVRVTAGWPSIV